MVGIVIIVGIWVVFNGVGLVWVVVFCIKEVIFVLVGCWVIFVF